MDADVIVVGAGFAGLAAARELSSLGQMPLVLEARSRVGGRAWTAERLGASIELGGAHVHWAQPYVWREIERYRLEVEPRPAPELVSLLVDGELRRMTVGQWGEIVERIHRHAFAPAKSLFPLPYEPLGVRDLVAEADQLSAAEHLARVVEDPADLEIASALWSIHVCADPARASLASAMRIAALAEGQIRTYMAIMSGFSLRQGTRALAQAMVADCAGEIRLNCSVAAIEEQDRVVTVTLVSGKCLSARAVIVAVPLSVLESIAFAPELPLARRRAVDRGQASAGMKSWMRVTPDPGPWVAFVTGPSPLQIIHRDMGLPDGTALVHGFGADHAGMDLNDVAAAQAVLSKVLPEVEVLEATGHDWIADPLSRETWPHFPPGGLVDGFETLRAPHGRIHFAGTLLARGWASFMDGAIETGIEMAQQLDRALRAEDD